MNSAVGNYKAGKAPGAVAICSYERIIEMRTTPDAFMFATEKK